MYEPKMKVKLRHGIAEPVSIELISTEVAHLARLPVQEGIEYLLGKVSPVHSNRGVASAFRETLHDPNCVIEIRQGDLVRVLTRRRPIGGIHSDLPEIEIGVSKANRGG